MLSLKSPTLSDRTNIHFVSTMGIKRAFSLHFQWACCDFRMPAGACSVPLQCSCVRPFFVCLGASLSGLKDKRSCRRLQGQRPGQEGSGVWHVERDPTAGGGDWEEDGVCWDASETSRCWEMSWAPLLFTWQRMYRMSFLANAPGQDHWQHMHAFTWHTRWNISHIHHTYFACPAGFQT